MKREKKKYVIGIAMTDEQREYVWGKASELGISVTSYMLLTATGKLRDHGDKPSGKKMVVADDE